MYLFGSAARGELESDSDVDVLVLLPTEVTQKSRDLVAREVFQVNLEFDVPISAIVLDRKSWTAGPVSVMPIKGEIAKEGVEI